MIDIPELIEKKRRDQAAEYLMQLQLSLASNNRVMEANNYKELVRNLTKNLEDKDKETGEEFDRHAFEALRLMTNMGANKTGGR